MPENEQQRFQTDLTITLALVRQRRPWIFRDLTHRDRSKADAARAALVEEIMAVAADYEIQFMREPLRPHSTPKCR